MSVRLQQHKLFCSCYAGWIRCGELAPGLTGLPNFAENRLTKSAAWCNSGSFSLRSTRGPARTCVAAFLERIPTAVLTTNSISGLSGVAFTLSLNYCRYITCSKYLLVQVSIKFIPRGPSKITKHVEREIINHSNFCHPHVVQFKV